MCTVIPEQFPPAIEDAIADGIWIWDYTALNQPPVEYSADNLYKIRVNTHAPFFPLE
jgi:hypothetical protein